MSGPVHKYPEPVNVFEVMLSTEKFTPGHHSNLEIFGSVTSIGVLLWLATLTKQLWVGEVDTPVAIISIVIFVVLGLATYILRQRMFSDRSRCFWEYCAIGGIVMVTSLLAVLSPFSVIVSWFPLAVVLIYLLPDFHLLFEKK